MIFHYKSFCTRKYKQCYKNSNKILLKYTNKPIQTRIIARAYNVLPINSPCTVINTINKESKKAAFPRNAGTGGVGRATIQISNLCIGLEKAAVAAHG